MRQSLTTDVHHKETPVEFFYASGSVSSVYEDDAGPIFIARGTKALRVDIQFIDNNDFQRNRQALLDGFPTFVERARQGGFTELIFESTSPLLRRFCKREFGFVESKDELRKLL